MPPTIDIRNRWRKNAFIQEAEALMHPHYPERLLEQPFLFFFVWNKSDSPRQVAEALSVYYGVAISTPVVLAFASHLLEEGALLKRKFVWSRPPQRTEEIVALVRKLLGE